MLMDDYLQVKHTTAFLHKLGLSPESVDIYHIK